MTLSIDRVVQQAVDGEVPPQHILLRVGEDDAGRTPSVNVSLIGTKCGDFKRMAAMNDQHDTELRPDTVRYAERSR